MNQVLLDSLNAWPDSLNALDDALMIYLMIITLMMISLNTTSSGRYHIPTLLYLESQNKWTQNKTKLHTCPTTNPRRKNKMTENIDSVTGTTTPKNVDNFFLLLSASNKKMEKKMTFLDDEPVVMKYMYGCQLINLFLDCLRYMHTVDPVQCR